MKFDIYDHRNGLRSVSPAERMGVENIIESISSPIGKVSPKDITMPIKDALGRLGWSGSVNVGRGTKITITSARGDVGMAIQFGNISRIYADFLKLQALYMEEKLSSAIVVVPHKNMLKLLSSSGGPDNRCSFERISREMPIFSKVITIPILLYGIYTEDENA